MSLISSKSDWRLAKLRNYPTLYERRFCVYCKRKRIRESGYSFFKFPLKKSKLLKKWLDNMGIKNWTPDKDSLLCSEHFEKTCLRKVSGKYLTLKEESIPTIFNRIECSDEKKSEQNLKQNQKIQFNNNKSYLTQKTSFNKLRSQVTQTLSDEEDLNKLLMFDKIRIINLDHRYHIAPSTLINKFIEIRERLKNKQHTIKIQRQQLERFKIIVKNLNETVKELERQRMISEKCLNCMSMVIIQNIQIKRVQKMFKSKIIHM